MSATLTFRHTIAVAALAALVWPVAVDAQGRGRRNLGSILGDVPMTAADDAIKEVVELLDFESSLLS